jgi:uncharacterized coiled-coil DUF342 family protein
MVDDEKATTGQKLEIRNKAFDPNYCKANELLRQIDNMKAERGQLLRQADQYRERIDTLEAEFHRLVIELEPTEVCTVRKRVQPDMMNRLQKALASRLADSPSLEEQLRKILGE